MSLNSFSVVKMIKIERHRKMLLLLLFGVLVIVNVYVNSGLMLYEDGYIKRPQFFPRPMEMIEPHDVLVLSYMRSGSTFIGKILGVREDTFYWFEPLRVEHKWRYLTNGGLLCNYRENICKNENSANSTNTIKKSLNFLKDIYGCKNLTNYYRHFTVQIQGAPRYTGPTGDAFHYCKERELKSRTECLSCERHNISCDLCKRTAERKCFNIAVKKCENSKHKVVKVLRLDTSLIQSLLEQQSRLKLIQIFRDPRAIMNSRNKTSWYFNETDPDWFHNETNYNSDFRVLCKRMKRDLKSAEKLRLQYPDRVKILQYEDFHDPYRIATDLYQFTGMVMRPDIHPFLKSLTYKKGAFHPDSYRMMLKWDLVNEINKHCYHVIKRLGLRVFNSEEELKNSSLNIVVDKLPYSINGTSD